MTRSFACAAAVLLLAGALLAVAAREGWHGLSVLSALLAFFTVHLQAEAQRGAGLATLMPLCLAGEPPTLSDPPCPVCDLHAIGEIALAALPRDNGRPAPLEGVYHVLPIDSGHIVAVESRQAGGPMEWRGAAVSGGEDWRLA